MNSTELERFGNQIREHGENQGRTMMDLVFFVPVLLLGDQRLKLEQIALVN